VVPGDGAASPAGERDGGDSRHRGPGGSDPDLRRDDEATWFEATAVAREARNLWVCASAFNLRGLAFYARHGFVAAAVVPGLVADGFDEILMRKFPLAKQG
jgi:hypothetical protein